MELTRPEAVSKREYQAEPLLDERRSRPVGNPALDVGLSQPCQTTAAGGTVGILETYGRLTVNPVIGDL